MGDAMLLTATEPSPGASSTSTTGSWEQRQQQRDNHRCPKCTVAVRKKRSCHSRGPTHRTHRHPLQTSDPLRNLVGEAEMSETEEFRVQSPVRSMREGSLERSSPIRHVDFNPGTPKSWSRQGTLDESSVQEDLSLGRSSPVHRVDFNPGTPKSWSRQGTLEENPPERGSPIRHVEFNPASPRSVSRQGTLDDPSKDNLSRPGSPLEKPAPLKSFDESNEPSQSAPREAEKTAESGSHEGPVEASGDPVKGGTQDGRSPIADAQSGRNGSTGVGEWNSLPVLVERLRAALELSLASSSHREETPALPEDSGVDSEEDFRVRSCGAEGILAGQEDEVKKDLKFLEELLLSDIETALSRLRVTLERIDVGALARQGAAGDPSSKLHLLKLVSSLLSRLQLPEEAPPEKKPPAEPSGVALATPRKRRTTRHTIGVSSEELASARRWLEEERERQSLLDSRKPSKVGDVGVVEELHHDKCTKDAINQRQSLRDKTKESARDERSPACRGVVAAQAGLPAQPEADPEPSEPPAQAQYQPKPQGCQAKADPAATGIAGHENEEGRVSQLAAALRQRAEMALSSGRFSGNNKFSAKKSRIKRANTIDIPSYLKLQAESQEGSGCVSLRRPIHVGDKTGPNTLNMLPSFQPRTDNDRKFLALITKNNEAPVLNQPGPFKPFGHNKPSEPSSIANKYWNSRFSNIKTTFDKPSTEGLDRGSLKNRMAKRFPAAWAASQASPGSNVAKDKPYTSSPSLKSESGFRHAPSSPFRKIEKPVPLSPTKVPPAYHWSKNGVQVATSSIKEKAKMMFDRDKLQPRGPPLEPKEPSGFPRPPWIDDQSKGAQNGRLDYRSFCKQFAPFVGKAVDAKLRGFEEQRHHATNRRASHGQVVDAKISFRMLPSSAQLPEARREPAQLGRERLSGDWRVFGYPEGKSGKGGDASEKEGKTNSFGDASLRGSSSVGVQTGLDEDHHGEARSFRVAPRITEGPPSLCSNACVQTGDLTSPWQAEERRSYAQPSQSRHFILDHNQNYRVIPQLPSNSPTSSSLELGKPRPRKFDSPEPIEKPRAKLSEQKPVEQSTKSEVKPKSFAPTILNSESRPEGQVSNMYEPRMDWPVENPGFLDDENIQNQDISPEVGVVTRYTCAIATVESVDSPEPRSEEAGPADSRTPSSPSPSQSWSRSRPPTNGTTTPEEEIRRHNLLQQSLVRRLQNERTSLNEPGAVSPSYSPSRTPNHLQESYEQPARVGPYQQDYYQPSNFLEPPAHQSPRFLSPSGVRAPDHPPRVPSPTAVGSANRIIALREAYEQQPAQPKPMQKERSPIPNGVNPIDSSDEYLVSCASKPSRSIVLSKSESWHQLAVNNSYPRAPRMNVPSGTTQACQNLPKPPKPKSPSTQKLRSKQYEASSSSDSVKRMEEKIRRYFDGPSDTLEVKESRSRRSSPRHLGKGLVGLTRSRTMPGICDEKLRLSLPNVQLPLLNVNTADVDKVFDDLFEEATRTDSHHC